MKKWTLVAAIVGALLCLSSCCENKQEKSVMARFVPERMDDFIWENEYICYRAYGKALEGNPTSPGFDLWVKTPGALVANERYRLELEEGKSYHINWGNGKDCYKVAVSLGAGASSPLVEGELIYPSTNYRSFKILEESPDKVVFALIYPEWEVDGNMVGLEKIITVKGGTYFCEVEDVYSGDFDSLTVAAGIFRHEVEDEFLADDRLAIWEKASDTSVESEDGMIGVALVMKEADEVCTMQTGDKSHGLAIKKIRSGEKIHYFFGSCWSKGELKSSQEWFEMVEKI